MKPINKYIIILPIEEEMVSSSGLLLSAEDSQSFRYKKARVIESGTQVDSIKTGDVIYFDKTAGHSMMIGNDTYTIIVERDVVVVL
jgi:co-chaperonin GroES (HSP10)